MVSIPISYFGGPQFDSLPAHYLRFIIPTVKADLLNGTEKEETNQISVKV
jgi:hypothetical protein